MKAQFIRSIGRCSLNGYLAEMYEEIRGVISIRIMHGQRVLRSIKFETIGDAENWLDMEGGDTEGAQRLNLVLAAADIGWNA